MLSMYTLAILNLCYCESCTCQMHCADLSFNRMILTCITGDSETNVGVRLETRFLRPSTPFCKICLLKKKYWTVKMLHDRRLIWTVYNGALGYMLYGYFVFYFLTGMDLWVMFANGSSWSVSSIKMYIITIVSSNGGMKFHKFSRSGYLVLTLHLSIVRWHFLAGKYEKIWEFYYQVVFVIWLV